MVTFCSHELDHAHGANVGDVYHQYWTKVVMENVEK
jgi:hypothetical protein